MIMSYPMPEENYEHQESSHHGVSMLTVRRALWLTAWAMGLVMALSLAAVVRQKHDFDRIVTEAGARYNVDPRLVASVIWKESRFDPEAMGTKGEIGLMQLREAAAREWAESESIEDFSPNDLFHPVTNIMAGTWYLSRGLEQWSHKHAPLPYVLAQYNAGRSNVLRWEEEMGEKETDFTAHIGFPTTQAYVQDILDRYQGRLRKKEHK